MGVACIIPTISQGQAELPDGAQTACQAGVTASLLQEPACCLQVPRLARVLVHVSRLTCWSASVSCASSFIPSASNRAYPLAASNRRYSAMPAKWEFRCQTTDRT